MHLRCSLVAGLLAIGLLVGCGSDESEEPSEAEVKEQFFQGEPIGFQADAPVEVTTDSVEFATSSEGWWSPEDDRNNAIADSLELLKASGFEAGTALKYSATAALPGRPRFVFGAVMAVDDGEGTFSEVADRVKAIAIHPCPWACVEESVPLKLPTDGGALGYSVLREIRPGGTHDSAVDVREVYATWASGDYVHLALLFDDAEGRNVDAFTSFIADEVRRTAAL